MKEKKLRIEDALAATKAAVEEGSVAGGGVALLNAIPAVKALLDSTEDSDEKTGVKIVLKALEEPVRQIASNAGLEGSVIINHIVESGRSATATTSLLTDMLTCSRQALLTRQRSPAPLCRTPLPLRQWF